MGKLKECKLQPILRTRQSHWPARRSCVSARPIAGLFQAVDGESTTQEIALTISFAHRGVADRPTRLLPTSSGVTTTTAPTGLQQWQADSPYADGKLNRKGRCKQGGSSRSSAKLADWAHPPAAASGAFLPVPTNVLHGIKPPADDVLSREFRALCATMQAVAPQPLYSECWRCCEELNRAYARYLLSAQLMSAAQATSTSSSTALRAPLRRLWAWVACGIAARSLDDIRRLRRASRKSELLEMA